MSRTNPLFNHSRQNHSSNDQQRARRSWPYSIPPQYASAPRQIMNDDLMHAHGVYITTQGYNMLNEEHTPAPYPATGDQRSTMTTEPGRSPYMTQTILPRRATLPTTLPHELSFDSNFNNLWTRSPQPFYLSESTTSSTSEDPLQNLLPPNFEVPSSLPPQARTPSLSPPTMTLPNVFIPVDTRPSPEHGMARRTRSQRSLDLTRRLVGLSDSQRSPPLVTYDDLGSLTVLQPSPVEQRKPFACQYCPKRFRRRRDRDRHERCIHTREAPYVCLCCDKAFVRVDARAKHWRTDTWCRDIHDELVQSRVE